MFEVSIYTSSISVDVNEAVRSGIVESEINLLR